MIYLMEKKHLTDIVKIHLESFANFFLTFLGARFLRFYYEGVLRHEDAIKLVFVDADEVKGFVVGTMNPSGFYKALLKNDRFRFGIASIPAIFKNPKSIFRLLRAFTKPSTTPRGQEIAELSSIAVRPDMQGKGIGKELLKAFINEVKNRGGTVIYLTTDAQNNNTVDTFYVRMGFKINQIIKTPENRLMNEFWLEISKIE